LTALREDLEAKKYLIDQFFGDSGISLTIDYVSNKTHKKAAMSHTKKTHTYKIEFADSISHKNENGDSLLVSFVRLYDLYIMYQDMGIRLFERNIRAGLSPNNSPNRAIRQALKNIVINHQDHAANFLFNHNGITISAEKFTLLDRTISLSEPRILNGAQTITSFARFLDDNAKNNALERNLDRLKDIRVLAKIIQPTGENRNSFVVNVTINNNRQNPVEPWNLRASDQLQLEIADRFAEELGVYYERLENSFASLTNEDLDDLRIEQFRSIELKKFAQTLMASQGEIDKISRLREVFESEHNYKNVFKDKYLRTDARRLLVAYKVHYRLNLVINSIWESGANKYWFASKARNLIWALLIQAVFNHKNISTITETHGSKITVEAEFGDLLRNLATRRVRFLLGEIIRNKKYAPMMRNEKYSFFRTKAVFDLAMSVAARKYRWRRCEP